MNDNISRVGIFGMGGVGKTTIAARINNELLGTNAFTHVIWVTASKESSIYKLQNDIAKMIKLDLSKEDDERKRAVKLRKKLESEKFVLILDDVWEAIETKEVGIPPLVSGQKLLLTSRNRRVCERMESRSIEVKPLFEQEALDLFMKESKCKINDSLEWKVIMRSIVRKCAGLPLAVVVVARRMRGIEEIREWRNTLRELENPCEGENHEVEKKLFRSLKFSYDRLPNDKFQQCFLYCSLFPEDYEFKRNDLITYWIGEGIINELYSKQAELDMGHCMIDELIHASLLEHNIRNGVDFIKMHDVVRDMALIVMRENSKAQDGLILQGLSEETQRVVNLKSVLIMKTSMLERDVPNLAPNCSKLTTLIFDKVYISKLLSCFFANIQNLTVLDMTNTSVLRLLPDSIGYLGNLRVLLLSYCNSLEYIPSLTGLKNLRHLDLRRTNLKEMPKGMEALINLRVLKLSWCNYSWDVFLATAISLEKLSHLQVLELEKVEVEANVLISLKKLETLRIAFYNLRSLNTYFKSGHWKRLEEYYIVYFQSRRGSTLRLWGEYDEHKKVLYMEELWDYGGGKGETDMVLPNNIRKLLLQEWNGMMVDVIKNTTFEHLRQLKIMDCIRLRLFTPALARGILGNVESLHIGAFTSYGVKEIISAEEQLVSEINNATTIELPNLKSLRLVGLANLRSIYKGRMVCPSLELIDITNCGNLEKLPFCMKEKERNKHNPIKLKVTLMPKQWWELSPNSIPNEWWDSLQWDDPNAKSIYQFEGQN